MNYCQTTIPFETSQAGEAEIDIFNESGQLIIEDHAEVLGPVRHLFYFTAARLPTGKYFYNIQFPHGKVIARNAMILVR